MVPSTGAGVPSTGTPTGEADGGSEAIPGAGVPSTGAGVPSTGTPTGEADGGSETEPGAGATVG